MSNHDLSEDFFGVGGGLGRRKSPMARDGIKNFKAKELGVPYRISFVYWPIMETADYQEVMPIDLLVEEYKKFEESGGTLTSFKTPLFLMSHRAYVKTGQGGFYLSARTKSEVKQYIEVFESQGRIAPKFQKKAISYVTEWPINKNTLKIKSLEDEEVETTCWVISERNFGSIESMSQMGRVFTDTDILCKIPESDGPVDFQKYVPTQLPGSYFFTLIKGYGETPDPDKRAQWGEALQSILEVVANRSAETSAKDRLLEKMGQRMTPDKLLLKLRGGTPTTSGTAVPPASADIPMDPSMDIDDLLSEVSDS